MKLDLGRIQKAIAGKKKKVSTEPIKTISRKTVSKAPVGKPFSKEQIEEKEKEIKRMAEDAKDQTEGEAQFGKDYKNLGLKYKTSGVSNSGKVTRYFKNDNEEQSGVREDVTSDESGTLRVIRTSPKPFGSGTTTEGFYETPESRKKRLNEEGKDRVMQMISKAQQQKPKEPTRYMSDENVSRLAEALKKKNNK